MPIAVVLFGYDADHQPISISVEREDQIDYYARRLVHNFENSPPVPERLRPHAHEDFAAFNVRVGDRLTWFRSMIGRPQIAGNVYKHLITVTPHGGTPRRTLRCWDKLCIHRPHPETCYADYYKKEGRWYLTSETIAGEIYSPIMIAQLEELLRQEEDNQTI